MSLALILRLLPYAKWVGIAAAGCLAVVYVQGLRLTIAHQKTEIVGYESALKQAYDRIDRDTVALNVMKRNNDGNLEELKRIQAEARNQLAVVTADRDRIKAEKQKIKVVRQVIHEQAQACTGDVHPGIGAAIDWLRGNPDVAPGSFGFNGDQAGAPRSDRGDAPVRPGTPAAPRPAR